MPDPSKRLLELLSLLRDGRAWQAAELAEALRTSPRTLRRDIERLRDLGYPVSSLRGPGGGYQLLAGRAMPPLVLTDDEAVATVVGLRFAALSRADGAVAAADSALRKLGQALPPRLRHRIEALSASTEAVSRVARPLDLRTVQLLGTAAHAHQDVRFHYTSRAGRHTERRVQPYRQVLFGGHWYLLGWDADRQDWRTFRLDRIDRLAVPGTTFTPHEPPSGEAAGFLQGSPCHGVVRFAAPLAHVSGRLMAQAGSLEAIDDDTCRYVTSADSWEWLAVMLAAVDVPYTIEGPPELVACSRRLAERIAAATRQSPGVDSSESRRRS
ncbi:transcriptional regulator [Nonomuraea sp. NPDC049695]|uniref:helix-turn-helix transcriptional regulator n=1 Tax=Nonomuraea sp. NPDC049695 TaxID=3154734 RepID=UPI003432DBB0